MVVPGALTSIFSMRWRRDKKFVGRLGGNVRESVTPSRSPGVELSPEIFFVATPKGDLNEGVREGWGESFRGEAGVIYRAAKA
jgi:hypothetical protein